MNTAESYTAGFLVSRRYFLDTVNVVGLAGTAKTANATWLSPIMKGAHVTLGKQTNMEVASLSVVAPAARSGRCVDDLYRAAMVEQSAQGAERDMLA